jgi:hypothetical protein
MEGREMEGRSMEGREMEGRGMEGWSRGFGAATGRPRYSKTRRRRCTDWSRPIAIMSAKMAEPP